VRVPYLREAGVVVGLLALAGWTWLAYDYGGSEAEAACLRTQNKALEQAIVDTADANKERLAAQRKADELAKLPPKVIERVRQNPSNCNLPKPVADGLRDQVNKTNAAVRALP